MSTESDTTTEEGEIQIQYSLIHARKENVERLTHTIPDLKRFVKSGNWLGRAPRGYDHYGPKVKNPKFVQGIQQLKVNDNNTFWSYSSTFGEGLYSPFDLVKKAEGLSYRELIYRCKQEGYKDTPIEPSEIDLAVEKLHFGYSAPPSVFSVCDPLKRLPEKDKYEMLDRLNIRKEVLLLVCTYLEVVPLNIPYDHRLKIENYLSDSFSEIAEIISREQMVLISAGTGIGKTSAVVDFLLKQPDKRGIFLAPLQVIVDQVSKENNLPALIGNNGLYIDIRNKLKKENSF